MPTYKRCKKYFRNKHFFLDPFALTIAQWCYIKLNSQSTGKATQETARQLLSDEGHLEEIQESYWRYVCVWGEEGEWDIWKERISSMRGLDDDIVEVRDAEEST